MAPLWAHYMGFYISHGFPDDRVPFRFFPIMWELYVADPVGPVAHSNLLYIGGLGLGWFIVKKITTRNTTV